MRPAFAPEAEAANDVTSVVNVAFPVNGTAANWKESQFVVSEEPAPLRLKVWLEES